MVELGPAKLSTDILEDSEDMGALSWLFGLSLGELEAIDNWIKSQLTNYFIKILKINFSTCQF